MPKLIDLTGQTFGRWTVLRRAERNGHHSYWECVCECGGNRSVLGLNLKRGFTTSCGCYSKTQTAIRSRTHGLTVGRTLPDCYTIWLNMKQRCGNKSSKSYPVYGGRGIVVCDRWRTSFANFIADMGPRPSKAHSIDRINNDGSYEPGNCRWATVEQQMNNQSKNRLLSFNGKTQTVSLWSREVGLRESVIRSRIDKNNWSVEKALTTAVHATRRGPRNKPV